MDLGDLRLPPGVERWYALKGAPAERGFYAVTVTVAVNGGSFTKKVGLCRVDRPAKISRSVLGISVAAGAWPAGLEHALKTVGARSVRVSLSNADLRQAEAGLARVGLKAWLDLSDEAAAALTAESGRLRVSDTWVGIQLPAASTALFQKIRDKSDLPLWAVADSVEDALGSINGPAAPLASATVSSRVFHSPQPGHLPSHLGLLAPQALQVYWVLSFAMGRHCAARACFSGMDTGPGVA